MSFGKYRFSSFAEYKTIQDLAVADGFITAKEFNDFLETNYSHLKK
jgi:hypothetical protein